MLFNCIHNYIYQNISFNLINEKIVCLQTKVKHFCISILTKTNLKEDISVMENTIMCKI